MSLAVSNPLPQYAWLIEGNVGPRGPVYWGIVGDQTGWTGDPWRAIRFARKDDAEAIIAARGFPGCKAVEHGFVN